MECDDAVRCATDPLILALPEWQRGSRPLINNYNKAAHLGTFVSMMCRVVELKRKKVKLFLGDGHIHGFLKGALEGSVKLDGVYKLQGFLTMRCFFEVLDVFEMPPCGDDSLVLHSRVVKMLEQNPGTFYSLNQ